MDSLFTRFQGWLARLLYDVKKNISLKKGRPARVSLVDEEGVRNFLGKIEDKNSLKCNACQTEINAENFQYLIREGDIIKFICSNPACVSQK